MPSAMIAKAVARSIVDMSRGAEVRNRASASNRPTHLHQRMLLR
jgi:hypothetical protein